MASVRIFATFLLVCVVLLSNTNMESCSATFSNTSNNKLFIKQSCNSTIYQNLCMKSLSPYYNKIKSSSTVLAYTALTLSLKQAKSTCKLVTKFSKRHDLKPNEASAVKDCVDNISDSIEELQRSITELRNLNRTELDYKVNSIKTWVSAALSDECTCTDGLDEAHVKIETKKTIRDNVVGVAQLTSNALAICNHLNYTQIY